MAQLNVLGSVLDVNWTKMSPTCGLARVILVQSMLGGKRKTEGRRMEMVEKEREREEEKEQSCGHS